MSALRRRVSIRSALDIAHGWSIIQRGRKLDPTSVLFGVVRHALTERWLTQQIVGIMPMRRGRPLFRVALPRRGQAHTCPHVQQCLELVPMPGYSNQPTIGGVSCNKRRFQKNSNARRSSLFGKQYRTRDFLRADVYDHIERFYNPKRNSTIGYVSPVEFENL
jgi:hypothetical protein